jgi:hypothetical protein
MMRASIAKILWSITKKSYFLLPLSSLSAAHHHGARSLSLSSSLIIMFLFRVLIDGWI